MNLENQILIKNDKRQTTIKYFNHFLFVKVNLGFLK